MDGAEPPEALLRWLLEIWIFGGFFLLDICLKVCWISIVLFGFSFCRSFGVLVFEVCLDLFGSCLIFLVLGGS